MDNVSERSIFLDREDAYDIEEEERNLFLRSILEEIGVPIDEIWPDISLSVEQKIHLRDMLSKLEIDILDIGNREYELYHRDDLLAKWYKPRYILKRDLKARTLNKKLFYEMVIKTWSVFEKENNE